MCAESHQLFDDHFQIGYSIITITEQVNGKVQRLLAFQALDSLHILYSMHGIGVLFYLPLECPDTQHKTQREQTNH